MISDKDLLKKDAVNRVKLNNQSDSILAIRLNLKHRLVPGKAADSHLLRYEDWDFNT